MLLIGRRAGHPDAKAIPVRQEVYSERGVCSVSAGCGPAGAVGSGALRRRTACGPCSRPRRGSGRSLRRGLTCSFRPARRAAGGWTLMAKSGCDRSRARFGNRFRALPVPAQAGQSRAVSSNERPDGGTPGRRCPGHVEPRPVCDRRGYIGQLCKSTMAAQLGAFRSMPARSVPAASSIRLHPGSSRVQLTTANKNNETTGQGSIFVLLRQPAAPLPAGADRQSPPIVGVRASDARTARLREPKSRNRRRYRPSRPCELLFRHPRPLPPPVLRRQCRTSR